MMMPLLISENLLKWTVKVNYTKWLQWLKIYLKFQIPYYHALNQWLLGAHQGQTETIIYP